MRLLVMRKFDPHHVIGSIGGIFTGQELEDGVESIVSVKAAMFDIGDDKLFAPNNIGNHLSMEFIQRWNLHDNGGGRSKSQGVRQSPYFRWVYLHARDSEVNEIHNYFEVAGVGSRDCPYHFPSGEECRLARLLQTGHVKVVVNGLGNLNKTKLLVVRNNLEPYVLRVFERLHVRDHTDNFIGNLYPGHPLRIYFFPNLLVTIYFFYFKFQINTLRGCPALTSVMVTKW